jgi:hypothetical protein
MSVSIDETVLDKEKISTMRANLLFYPEMIRGLNTDSRELTVEKLKTIAAIDRALNTKTEKVKIILK